MSTYNIYNLDEKDKFFACPQHWKCNCSRGPAQYSTTELDFSAIIYQCGHELTRYEFNEYLNR